MTRTILVLVSFAGGLAVGLLAADYYAKHKATGTADSLLQAIGLGGGKVQGTVDAAIPVLIG